MAEKTKGRKRHIVPDIMGNLIFVIDHRANIHATKSGFLPAIDAFYKYPSFQAFCADMGYRGYRKTFVNDIKRMINKRVDISGESLQNLKHNLDGGEWSGHYHGSIILEN